MIEPEDTEAVFAGVDAMLREDYALLRESLRPLPAWLADVPVVKPRLRVRALRRWREISRRLGRAWHVLRTGDDGRDCW